MKSAWAIWRWYIIRHSLHRACNPT